mgnify:CR=1 FL=1
MVLGAGGATVDAGQPFFIPLGADLPSGRYGVTLVLEKGPAQYLTLGEAIPRPLEERKLFIGKPVP